jgi:eukaryotic-like serine/threonine-protein kinase
MSIDFADASTMEIEEDAARALVSQIIARSPGQRIDANAVLKANPGLCRYESLILDLAYEEFCRRTDAGERPERNSFARRFPEVEHSLLRVLEVHDYLDHHPDTMFKEPSTGWPQARDEIGGFTLVREIGRGGFSRVFLAREIDLGNREVVVKVSNLPNEEAARLGQLAHPNIVPVHSVRTLESGLTLICMPHLRAVTLGHVLDQLFTANQVPRHGREILQAIGQADDDAADESDAHRRRKARIHWTMRSGSYAEAIIQLGAQVCDGLGYAHQQDVYHCDIKPSNVLLTPAGEALLFDFNLSLQRGTAAAIGGTLPYMAPEQLRCLMADDLSPQIDHRTDIFSLGVTIFQLLTGKMPFAVDEPGGDRKQAATHLLEKQQAGCQELDEVERLAGPQLRRLIERCLAFDPDDRPASAEQVARELRNCLSPPRRLQRWYRAHRLAVWLATAILVLIR